MTRTSEGPRGVEAHNRRYEAAFQYALNAIVFIDEEGMIVEANSSALEMFGYTQEELIRTNVTNLMPEEYRARHTQSLSRYLTTGQASVMGMRVRLKGLRKDSEVFPLELEVHEVPSSSRREFVGVIRDVTEREVVERELHHRMGNLFAVILGVVNLIGKTTHTLKDFREALKSQLEALSCVNNLLQRNDFEWMSLVELLETLSRPFALEGYPKRIALQGGNVRLVSSVATSLGLIFNELATNSTKHGSLKEVGGRVVIRWDVLSESDGQRLRFFWQEFGTLSVEEPKRTGFGTGFIERAAKGLRGEANFVYLPEGMQCTIEISLAP